MGLLAVVGLVLVGASVLVVGRGGGVPPDLVLGLVAGILVALLVGFLRIPARRLLRTASSTASGPRHTRCFRVRRAGRRDLRDRGRPAAHGAAARRGDGRACGEGLAAHRDEMLR